MDEEPLEAVTDALSNIPGLGPARKAALYAAGITTRAALAQASVEQIISLTGMPRTQAEKALETLQATDAPLMSAPSPQVVPPTDEAMPTAAPSDIIADTDGTEATETEETALLLTEDAGPDDSARGILDRAAFRVKTALSDATRVWSFPKISRSLTRLAAALDFLTEETTGTLHPRIAKRLAKRLESLSAGIEKALGKEKPLTDKQRTRLRERLKSERVELETTMKAALQRRAEAEKKAAKIASREPKETKKRSR